MRALAGLVNALLRRFVRERATLLANVDRDPVAAAAHPPWLAAALRRAWPQHAAAVMASNNVHPPMTLRVDLTRVDRDGYLALLQQAGVEARSLSWAPEAIELAVPAPIGALPKFAHGWASVQDAGCAAGGGPARPAAGVCASWTPAPRRGGKTLHILERAQQCDLIACDADGTRLMRVRDNLERCGRNAELVVADMANGRTPDGSIAPQLRMAASIASSSMRHVRRPVSSDRTRTSVCCVVSPTLRVRGQPQRALLEYAISRLKPGGRLLYCTCSVIPEENDAVIARVSAAADSTVRVIAPRSLLPAANRQVPDAILCTHGVQLLPGSEAGTDGFYYACLEKDTFGTH